MLNKKMIRDIRKNLSQFITIFLMVMIGIMAYSGIEAYMDGMQKNGDKFYLENNLYDLFAMSDNITDKTLEEIKNIENVKDAERKLSITALTDNDKTILLNLIESNNIAKFYVQEGIPFDNNKHGIWLEYYYALENNIKVGDNILIKYENMELHQEVLGLIQVPDHLYDVRDESELYPDRSKFGFAYMSINELTEDYIKSKVMKETGIDDVKTFDKMMPDFNKEDYYVFPTVMIDVDDVDKIDEVKNKINDIDGIAAVLGRDNIVSYKQYQGEIDEGKTYVGVFSGLFLFIAMLSVITTMNRIVKNQRIQIGTLKALGYSNNRIIMHYISYGFWISFFAAITGLVLGYYFIGNTFIKLETDFFDIPFTKAHMYEMSYIVALAVILIVCLISYITCRTILKENPAETLRNKIPNVKQNSLNITTKGIFKHMNFSSKWNVRDMLRNKMRTLMGLVGVLGCSMLIVCAFGMFDSMNFFIELQFERIFNFDYKLVLKENIKEEELEKLYSSYGNHTSKTYGIEIRKDDKLENNNIFVTDANEYVRFVNNDNDYIDVHTSDGVFITQKLAKIKGYNIGDYIEWHIYGDNEYHKSKIIGFNKDPQNQNITMTRKYLEDELKIKYIPDSLYTNVDLSNIKEIENVETIQNISQLKEGMESMLSMMKTMLVLIIFFAIVLGSVIIYNLGILSYTEKQYQFSTLKVLGFTDKRIKGIFIKQNNWIAIVSSLIGLPAGYYLTDWIFKTAIEETYDFGAHIELKTYIFALVGTFIVSYIVSRLLARKIKDIDMVSSLKGNE